MTSQFPTRHESSESESRSLPVVIGDTAEPSEGWLTRVMRILFGWKAASTRADLELVLTADELQSGFSPTEATMLKNILSLRETRIERVMVPRADIVAVQQDIPLGELVKMFESATHSRLVVYNDTLDDPSGMIHIRDLVAFMAAHATVEPSGDREPADARPDNTREQSELDLVRYRSGDAARSGKDHPRDALRAAIDAGARSIGQDAGHPHSSGARHR